MNATWGFNGNLAGARDYARQLATKYGKPISIWVLGCSTAEAPFIRKDGDRPYTLATAEAGNRVDGGCVETVEIR